MWKNKIDRVEMGEYTEDIILNGKGETGIWVRLIRGMHFYNKGEN